MPSTLERFETKYFVAPDGCWIWLGATTKGGYGVMRYEKGNTTAHRVSYQLFVGEIGGGLHVDHLCRQTFCVNPHHLEAVTPYVNTRRRSDLVTHCPRGHEYNEENTYVWRKGKGSQRHCKTCRSARMTAWNERIRSF